MQPLDSEWAGQAARVFSRRIVADPNLFRFSDDPGFPVGIPLLPVFHPDVLERFLTHMPRPQARKRAVAIAAAVGTTPGGPLTSFAFLQSDNEPLPYRLTTQDLVEFLKMPTCVGELRRVILDQLGNRYGRRFDTHWAFVRYAQEQRLDLDFTTPAKRPDPKLPPLFQE